MGQATSGKTCVLCGQDCSQRQRVQDSQGRYYCKACHDAARARRDAALNEETAADVDPAMFDHPGNSPGGGTTMDATAIGHESPDNALGAVDALAAARAASLGAAGIELNPAVPHPTPQPHIAHPTTRAHSTDDAQTTPRGQQADEADAHNAHDPHDASEEMFDAGSSVHAARRCPKCLAVVAADSARCDACGRVLDVDVHEQAIKEARRVKTREANLFTALKGSWPHHVGLCCKYVGWLELPIVSIWFITEAWRLLSSGAIRQTLQTNWRVGMSLGLGAALIGLAWWITRIGEGIRHRIRYAVTSAKQWAILKIIICGGAFTTWLMLATDGLADHGVLLFAATLVWLLLWPTFMLFWLSRDELKHQINEWGRIGV